MKLTARSAFPAFADEHAFLQIQSERIGIAVLPSVAYGAISWDQFVALYLIRPLMLIRKIKRIHMPPPPLLIIKLDRLIQPVLYCHFFDDCQIGFNALG